MKNKTIKQSVIVGFVLVVMVLVACPAPDNSAPKKWSRVDTGSSTAIPPTLFSARFQHTSVVLGSNIYVIGGNEVWKSGDKGATWSKITPNTPVAGTLFSVRVEHSSVVLGTDIYVIGGSDGGNEVWKSSDGVTWSEVTPTDKAAAVGNNTLFSVRKQHSSVVLGTDIYVIGGSDIFGGTTRGNEVWKSGDGVTWSEVTPTAKAAAVSGGTLFSGRYGHSSVVIGSDIYVIGGATSSKVRFNEVWKSSDRGVTWREVTADKTAAVTVGTLFSTRDSHSSVVFDGGIYVIGGSGSDSAGNEVWKSSDGVTWSEVTPTDKAAAVSGGTLFSARYQHSSVVFDGGIYVIGGNTGGNEVWVYK